MMGYFRYFAVNQQGLRQRGVLVAAHEADLTQRLAGMGLDLVTASAVHPRARSTLTRRELIALFVHLTHVSRAGIALMDGLRDLRDNMPRSVTCEIITTLLAEMEGGHTLSMAMAAQPKIFDTLMVSLVRVGEVTGALSAIFMHLADSLKRLDELHIQAQRILLYPSLVLVMVSAVIIMLLLFLVPQIVQLMLGMGMVIPMGTQLLLVCSSVLKAYWWLILALMGSSVASVVALYYRNLRFRLWCDGWKLRMPVLGEILQKIDLARFADFFALMYQSGIPVFDALALSADLVQNRVLVMAIRRAREAIINGERLSEAFAREQVFPPLVVSMLRMGETTGALDSALLEVRYFYQRDVREAIETALKLLEPLLTLILGLVLAAIVGMVVLPLYEVLGAVKL